MRGFPVIILPLLLACSAATDTPSEATPSSTVMIQVTSDLSADAQQYLAADFRRLENSTIVESASVATKTFGVPLLDKATLVSWLNARVQYLVGDTFFDYERFLHGDLPRHINVLSNESIFPDADIYPEALRAANQARFGTVSLAENLGISIYLTGKFSRTLYGILIPGADAYVPVSSPRIGVLKLGNALFGDWLKENIRFQDKAASGELNSPLASEYRLGILFHEARHSDGHGRSLGFLHTVCPKDHDYAGQVSCDASLNGAYAVGGEYLKLAARDCGDCSVKDREVLRVFAADALGRVLVSQQVRVSEEEALLRCRDLLEKKQVLPDSCFYDYVPSQYWDAAPEEVMKL